MNAREFPDTFIKFEKENALFLQQIDDVFYWKLIRGRVYNNILKKHGLLDEGSFTVPQSVLCKIKTFFKYCIVAFINLFKPLLPVDTLVVNHQRKVLINGKYEDIYTSWLINHLDENDEKYLVLDVPQNWGEHPMPMTPNIRKIENFTIISKVVYKFFLPKAFRFDQKLKNYSKKLKQVFDFDGNIINEAYEQIHIFKIDYKYYLKFLKKVCPKKIWVVVGYGNHALIAAAKELGIVTEEIQHSLISKHHMNYGFGGLKNVPYFPDRMCLFGKFWYDISDIPLSEDKIDYYKNQIRKYEPSGNRENKNKKIMFLTQPIITKYMIDIIEEMIASQKFDNFDIIIKLHPAEFNIWKNKHEKLKQLSSQGYVEVVDSFEMPLYDLFREVDTVIAVASTALFEALYFGCDVYLLSVPCIVWIESLCDGRFPAPIKSVDDLERLVYGKVHNNIDIDEIFYKG